MLSIILLMLAGISIGFFVISRDKSGKALKACVNIQQFATIVLLFVMGLWLGGNPEFWANIKTMGIQGFLFAAVTIAGSLLSVLVISGFMPRGE